MSRVRYAPSSQALRAQQCETQVILVGSTQEPWVYEREGPSSLPQRQGNQFSNTNVFVPDAFPFEQYAFACFLRVKTARILGPNAH